MLRLGANLFTLGISSTLLPDIGLRLSTGTCRAAISQPLARSLSLSHRTKQVQKYKMEEVYRDSTYSATLVLSVVEKTNAWGMVCGIKSLTNPDREQP